MAVDLQQILDQMDKLQIEFFEDLAKNNQKFMAMWASCSKRGHLFIFNFESVGQKLLQQQDISDVLDDMIITILVAEWYQKQIGYPNIEAIREELKSYRPNTPPEWLINRYQNQEMLLNYITDTNAFWFNQATRLHQLLGQGYQRNDLVEMARSFKVFQDTFNNITNTIR